MSQIVSKQRAPVVSSDSNSPEAELAKSSATLQFQSQSDGVYDTTIERFCDYKQDTLLLGSIALGLAIVLGILIKSKNK